VRVREVMAFSLLLAAAGAVRNLAALWEQPELD
jgi:hypothetical protein